MGSTLSRREFGKLVCSAVGASSFLFPGMQAGAAVRSRRHVVVIGGGFGGAAAARNLRLIDPSIRVTLVEPKAVYHTCPFSNWVLGGLRSMEQIAHSYRILGRRHGVEVVADVAKSVDPAARKVRLGSGRTLSYDRLVVSPGIELLWNAIPGYGRQVAESRMPHAYEAGPQTALLRRQLLSLRDGENVIIVSPANQFRCPAAPYERASLVALYLKQHKPKSKVVILDAKEGFTKQDLFMQGWERRYPGMIEWRSGSGGGKVERIDAAAMTVSTEFGDEKGGVVNVIPPQRAGRIAQDSGLADASGWCPVDPVTFESTIHPGIHVIGDAIQGSPMPKSGTSAHTQGRVVAAAISGLFGGGAPAASRIESLCYSLIGPEYAISVRGTYTQTPQGFAENRQDVGLTPMEATTDQLAAEQAQAISWYRQITADTWG